MRTCSRRQLVVRRWLNAWSLALLPWTPKYIVSITCLAAGKTLKRRSEVDRRLEQLVQKQSWKLKEPGQQSVIKVRPLHAAAVLRPVLPHHAYEAKKTRYLFASSPPVPLHWFIVYAAGGTVQGTVYTTQP